MAHYARINSDNIVEDVIYIHNDIQDGLDFIANTLKLEGRWIQCSYNGNIRGMFPGKGHIYNQSQDRFETPLETVIDRLERLVLLFTKNTYELYDRFGIFAPLQLSSNNINDLKTTLSFKEIVDERVDALSSDDIYVLWSGGIDSTLVVSALLKFKKTFKIVTQLHCIDENPDFHNYLLAHNVQIVLMETSSGRSALENYYNFVRSIANDAYIICGEPANQLTPSCRIDYLKRESRIDYRNLHIEPDLKARLLEPVPDNLVFDNLEDVLRNRKKLSQDDIDFIQTSLLNAGIAFKHYYQLEWLFKFIFKYQFNLDRFKNVTPNSNRLINFFDTQEFQAWAWTNLDHNFDTYSVNPWTEKMEFKEYIRDVTGLDSQLELIKRASNIY